MKSLYRKLCDTESTVPLFCQAWWLDAVAGDAWDAVLVERGGHVMAAMPYIRSRRFGLDVLGQPPLTQHLGPWIRASTAKYAKRLAQEKDFLEELADKLPTYAHFRQNWNYGISNWLPFYWKGFSQTTRYTYRIEELGDEERLWANLQPNIRTDIRKASVRVGIRVRTDAGLDDFLRLNAMVFERQGRRRPYSTELVQRIDAAAEKRGCRKIYIAEDNEGRHHAAAYVIWDQHSAYYLMGGGDPELRNSGATSLCLWEAVRHASSVTRSFDFEGSMMEPVERFFRAFGAVQTAYHSISRTPSRLMRTALIARSLVN